MCQMKRLGFTIRIGGVLVLFKSLKSLKHLVLQEDIPPPPPSHHLSASLLHVFLRRLVKRLLFSEQNSWNTATEKTPSTLLYRSGKNISAEEKESNEAIGRSCDAHSELKAVEEGRRKCSNDIIKQNALVEKAQSHFG